ncbi:MAG: hypothetical protein M3N54_16550 [Acidobacteriota bacterium]|nr:hypothetical protein [Acidobacteriota bacterium]
MIKAIALVLVGLIVGFAAAALFRGRQITMTVVKGLPNKAPATIIMKKDVIKWTDAASNPLSVRFDYASPCAEGVDQLISTCTVNVPNGMFAYSCANDVCPDPEVPVGSDYGGNRMKPIPTPAVNPPGFNPLVAVYCSRGTPNTASAAPQTATAAQAFNWLGVGSPAPDWTVSDVAAGVCREGTSFSPANSLCTVQPGRTGSYTYRVHITGCPTPDGTGSLTIR